MEPEFQSNGPLGGNPTSTSVDVGSKSTGNIMSNKKNLTRTASAPPTMQDSPTETKIREEEVQETSMQPSILDSRSETTGNPQPDRSDNLEQFLNSPRGQNAIVERSPGGRYVRFLEKLGSGASKDVYRAYDTTEGIEVAWNVVQLSGVPKTERNRIVNEVRLLERLHHSNIISFHGSWVNRERHEVNFVTEILSSGTLKSFVEKVQVIRWKIAKRWAVQILKGLEYLHSQDPPVIHRDLKCENIFINGTSGDLRIGDLGLSTVHRNGQVLSVLGTPEFMAPDLYEESAYDEKVDIYAFGMCLLEIFTKEIPYRECNNPAQIYKKVTKGALPDSLGRLKSTDARDFIMLCLGYKDESGKYIRPSATELLNHPFLAKGADDDSEVELLAPLLERTIREVKSNEEVPLPKSRRSTRSADHDDSVGFEEMPDSEVNIKKVKVLMGRGQELQEEDETTDTTLTTNDKTDTTSNSGHGSAHYLVAAAVIEDEGQWPYADDILKLIITLPVDGETQNVQFDFHLVDDDAVQVAREMVSELGIPQEAVLEVGGTISALARQARKKQQQYRIIEQQRQQEQQQQQQQQQQQTAGQQDPILQQGMPNHQHHTRQEQATAPFTHAVPAPVPAAPLSSGSIVSVSSGRPASGVVEQSTPAQPASHTHAAPAAQASHHQHVISSGRPAPGMVEQSISTPAQQAPPPIPSHTHTVAQASHQHVHVEQPAPQNVHHHHNTLQQPPPAHHSTTSQKALPQQEIKPVTKRVEKQHSLPIPIPQHNERQRHRSEGSSIREHNDIAATTSPSSAMDNTSPTESTPDEDDDDDEDSVSEEMRQLEEDFQKNFNRAQKVFDNRMDNLQRTKQEKEALHLRTLEKHEKERMEYEKRVQQEQEEQAKRLEKIQREYEEKRELIGKNRKKQTTGQPAPAQSGQQVQQQGRPNHVAPIQPMRGQGVAVQQQQPQHQRTESFAHSTTSPQIMNMPSLVGNAVSSHPRSLSTSPEQESSFMLNARDGGVDR